MELLETLDERLFAWNSFSIAYPMSPFVIIGNIRVNRRDFYYFNYCVTNSRSINWDEVFQAKDNVNHCNIAIKPEICV